MVSRKFSAAEVLHILADGEDEQLDVVSQREFDQESEDEAEIQGDYSGEDGEQVIIPSELLHPDVRGTLGRLVEEQLPCERNSLLLCDSEVSTL